MVAKTMTFFALTAVLLATVVLYADGHMFVSGMCGGAVLSGAAEWGAWCERRRMRRAT